MEMIILIPGILCVIAFFRDSVQKAFLNVYLPVFMLLPAYYYWKVASLPPFGPMEAVLIPLGVAMLATQMPRWKFSFMDLWIGLFAFSAYYADAANGLGTAATFELFNAIALAVVPYMAGKLLIEVDDGRVQVLKRLVFCLFVTSILSAYEYRMGQNPFTLVFSRFFPAEKFPWKTQIRWGFGRVSGPFGQSELAGMMLFFGLVLTIYLAYNKLWEPKFGRAAWLPLRKSTVIGYTLAFTLLMTQARGPWIGALIAIPIALLGRAKRVLLASVVLGTLCLVGGPLIYAGLQAYTASSTPGSAEQETATYRAHLLDNYMPIAEQGGAFGWGQAFPRVQGQNSIDNEYLFVALTQGWVGLLCFCALGVGALYHLVMAAIYNPTARDRYFAFSLLGIMVGLLVTIFTVFLGNQPYQLFFLLAGWAQAVRVRRVRVVEMAFEHVYT